MRDLKADLDEWNSDLINGIRSTDWFYLAGEYIERAIDAEEELEKQQQLFEAQTGRNVEIIKRLNERKKEVCEENATLRDKMRKINDIAVNYQEDGPFIDTVTFAIISEIYDLSLGKE